MKYEVSYLLLPTIMTSLLVGMFSACISYGVTGTRTDIFVSGGIGGLVGLFLGVVWVTPSLLESADPEIKMMAYELRRGVHRQEELQEVTVRAENKDGTQVDFFRGLKPKQWHDCAVRIAAKNDFTYATVGQVERPILEPMMLAAGYIVSVGQGKYELTDAGLAFWKHMAVLPYPWEHAPQKLRNAPLDDIYT